MSITNEKQSSVVVGLSGGLGNQMFQYAAGRCLAHRLSCNLQLDLSWFQGRNDRVFALQPFNIVGSQLLTWPWLSGSGQALLSRIYRRFMPRIMGLQIWREPHFHFCAGFFSITQPVYLEGYWQSQRYFMEIRSQLLLDFSLLLPLPEPCQLILEQIRGYDSICVHVRRGDYVSNPSAAKLHGVCSISYYLKGIAELVKGLRNPHCFIFSDDPEWVRNYLHFEFPMTIVDINGTRDVHLDLIMMSSCRNFLIANSSLSWWGAWLGSHPKKKVIAPISWFNKSNKDTKDLLPSEWIQL